MTKRQVVKPYYELDVDYERDGNWGAEFGSFDLEEVETEREEREYNGDKCRIVIVAN